MKFSDRYGPWAVIAGASEGTGREFAIQVAKQGVSCILVARREAALNTLADQIRSECKVECLIVPADLAQSDASTRIIDAVGAREVGLFISNAGSDPNGARFLDRSIDVWIELAQRNVMTMMRCCHHFARSMKQRKRGGLLLVNSGACYGGSAFMAAYAGSKAFTLCFAEALWGELSPHGVDVLTLVMHMTDTPALRTLLAEKNLPVPSGIAKAEDVAALGLARLPYGPIQNWGIEDADAGWAMISASDRRKRVVAVGKASEHVFGKE